MWSCQLCRCGKHGDTVKKWPNTQVCEGLNLVLYLISATGLCIESFFFFFLLLAIAQLIIHHTFTHHIMNLQYFLVALTDRPSSRRRAPWEWKKEKRGKWRKCVRTRTQTGRRTTKGSPSGGEGRADSAAVRHVAVATWRGWDVAGREPGKGGGRRRSARGGTMEHTEAS